MVPPDLLSLSDIILNIQEQIPQLMEIYGIWICAILFANIFYETGLGRTLHSVLFTYLPVSSRMAEEAQLSL